MQTKSRLYERTHFISLALLVFVCVMASIAVMASELDPALDSDKAKMMRLLDLDASGVRGAQDPPKLLPTTPNTHAGCNPVEVLTKRCSGSCATIQMAMCGLRACPATGISDGKETNDRLKTTEEHVKVCLEFMGCDCKGELEESKESRPVTSREAASLAFDATAPFFGPIPSTHRESITGPDLDVVYEGCGRAAVEVKNPAFRAFMRDMQATIAVAKKIPLGSHPAAGLKPRTRARDPILQEFKQARQKRMRTRKVMQLDAKPREEEAAKEGKEAKEVIREIVEPKQEEKKVSKEEEAKKAEQAVPELPKVHRFVFWHGASYDETFNTPKADPTVEFIPHEVRVASAEQLDFFDRYKQLKRTVHRAKNGPLDSACHFSDAAFIPNAVSIFEELLVKSRNSANPVEYKKGLKWADRDAKQSFRERDADAITYQKLDAVSKIANLANQFMFLLNHSPHNLTATTANREYAKFRSCVCDVHEDVERKRRRTESKDHVPFPECTLCGNALLRLIIANSNGDARAKQSMAVLINFFHRLGRCARSMMPRLDENDHEVYAKYSQEIKSAASPDDVMRAFVAVLCARMKKGHVEFAWVEAVKDGAQAFLEEKHPKAFRAGVLITEFDELKRRPTVNGLQAVLGLTAADLLHRVSAGICERASIALVAQLMDNTFHLGGDYVKVGTVLDEKLYFSSALTVISRFQEEVKRQQDTKANVVEVLSALRRAKIADVYGDNKDSLGRFVHRRFVSFLASLKPVLAPSQTEMKSVREGKTPESIANKRKILLPFIADVLVAVRDLILRTRVAVVTDVNDAASRFPDGDLKTDRPGLLNLAMQALQTQQSERAAALVCTFIGDCKKPVSPKFIGLLMASSPHARFNLSCYQNESERNMFPSASYSLLKRLSSTVFNLAARIASRY